MHPSVGLNGAGKSWVLLLEALRGYCEIWTSQPGPPSEEVGSLGHSVPIDCPHISRRVLANAYYVLSFPLFVLSYARLIRSADIDIVHCNAVYLWQAMTAARLCRRRLVVHVREAREKYPAPLYRAWVAYAELLADTLICVSQADMKHFNHRDLVHVPNWVAEPPPPPDSAETPSLPMGFEPGSKAILVVSQIIRGKGHDYALDVFKELLRIIPGLKLFIAGGTNGNENNERFLRTVIEKAAAMGLAEEVVFLGEVRDVVPLMRSAGCVLMPSRSESFSRVHLEAMSSGSLLVATDVGMTSRVVDDMVDGVVIPWGNAPLAAEKISRVLRSPALAAEMRAKAVRKIAERFSAKTVVPEFRRVFFGSTTLRPEAPCAAS